MAESEAQLAIDVGFELEDAEGSGVYVPFDEVLNVVPGEPSTEQVDVTHMKSPGRYREFKSGFTDGGEMTVEMNYIPGSDTDQLIRAWRAGGGVRSSRVLYPEGETDTQPVTYVGYSTPLQLGEAMRATLTMRVAGLPVFAG